jgi:hypothetical protein
MRFLSYLCCRQPVGSEYVCTHVGHCRCGRFLEWAAKSMSSLWSILTRRKTWSSMRLLSSKMSGRCHNSEKDGCSSPSLTTEAWCLESIASLFRCCGSVTVPMVASRGVSSSMKQVGKKSSELLALKFCGVSSGGGLSSFPNSVVGWLCMASSKVISSTYAMGGFVVFFCGWTLWLVPVQTSSVAGAETRPCTKRYLCTISLVSLAWWRPSKGPGFLADWLLFSRASARP